MSAYINGAVLRAQHPSNCEGMSPTMRGHGRRTDIKRLERRS